MRLKVIGNIDKEKMPLSYRTMVMSFIKKAIELGDKECFKELYYYKDKKNKKIKPFCFSVYLNDFKIINDQVQVNGDISITISTADYNLGIVLYNGLLKIKEHSYKDITFIKNRVILEKESKVTTKEAIFKTLSPIYIKDKNNKVLSPDNPKYVEELNYISNLLLKTYRGYGLTESLEFTPLQMKKTVIKEKIKDFIKNSNKEFIYINGYLGIFKLKGNIEDLQLLMELGIGFRRSEGFGLVDLA